MRDDDSDPLPAPIVPLPRRLPADALGRLISDTLFLLEARAVQPGAGASPTIVAYRPRGDGGTIEAWETCHAGEEDAAKRALAWLEEGGRLAIPIHGDRRLGAMHLIDGGTLEDERPGIGGGAILVGPQGRDDDIRPTGVDDFPALGLGLDGLFLSVEPMLVGISRGSTQVRPTAFPEALRRRIAAYLARLA